MGNSRQSRRSSFENYLHLIVVPISDNFHFLLPRCREINSFRSLTQNINSQRRWWYNRTASETFCQRIWDLLLLRKRFSLQIPLHWLLPFLTSNQLAILNRVIFFLEICYHGRSDGMIAINARQSCSFWDVFHHSHQSIFAKNLFIGKKCSSLQFFLGFGHKHWVGSLLK